MDWTNPFIIGPLCAGAGILIGMLVMRLLDRGRSGAKALATLREEFDDYRSNVNQHFEKTSSLFKEMTEKYRDVYDHLATGAQQFGGSEELPPRLEITQAAGQLTAATATAPSSTPKTETPPLAAATGERPTAAFDPSSLDESELADLTEPAAATAATPASPAARPGIPEHRFRSMPDTDESATAPAVAAATKPGSAETADENRQERATVT